MKTLARVCWGRKQGRKWLAIIGQSCYSVEIRQAHYMCRLSKAGHWQPWLHTGQKWECLTTLFGLSAFPLAMSLSVSEKNRQGMDGMERIGAPALKRKDGGFCIPAGMAMIPWVTEKPKAAGDTGSVRVGFSREEAGKRSRGEQQDKEQQMEPRTANSKGLPSAEIGARIGMSCRAPGARKRARGPDAVDTSTSTGTNGQLHLGLQRILLILLVLLARECRYLHWTGVTERRKTFLKPGGIYILSSWPTLIR